MQYYAPRRKAQNAGGQAQIDGGPAQIAGGQAQIAGGQPQIDGGPLTSIIPDMRLFIIINIKLWKYFRNKKPKVYLMKYKK